jgi:hypothetical protein
MAELEVKLNKSGLQVPPPSKKEQRARREESTRDQDEPEKEDKSDE